MYVLLMAAWRVGSVDGPANVAHVGRPVVVEEEVGEKEQEGRRPHRVAGRVLGERLQHGRQPEQGRHDQRGALGVGLS